MSTINDNYVPKGDGSPISGLDQSNIYAADSGNVGIGTTDPIQRLTVSGVLRVQNQTINTRRSDHFIGTGDSSAHINAYDDTESNFLPLCLDGSPTLLNPASGGNVGIGTTNPGANLHIKGSSSDDTTYAIKTTDSSSRSLYSIRNDGRIDLGFDRAAANAGASIIIVPSPTQNAVTDTTNIQAAIDQAAQNGGGTVVLQKGRYALELRTFSVNGIDYSCSIRLYAGVRLVGAGMFATYLNAYSAPCHVIMTDPAQWVTDHYEPKYGICVKDLQILAGPNSNIYFGLYLNGAANCLIENVFINGMYGNGSPGYHFDRGIQVKGWVGTLINCFVCECHQGFNLSWIDDLNGFLPDHTNAIEMVGCHFEGGTLPPPQYQQLIGCFINGFGNHLSGCTIERRLTESVPLDTLGIHIKTDSGNTVTGCYFEGWRVTFKLDGCSETTVMGGFMSTCSGIDAVQFYNGADAISNDNKIFNMCQLIKQYSGGIWVILGSGTRDVIQRISITPYNTIPDNGYNGNLVVTKPATSGQYINLIRSGNQAWSIGTVYNTNYFAIGQGQATDSSFTNPFFVIRNDNGNVGIGTTSPFGKLTVQGGTPDAGDLFVVNNANGHKIGGIYPDGANNGVFHVLDDAQNKKVQLWSNGYSWINGGNVGIGVTSPKSKLHVEGSVGVKVVSKGSAYPAADEAVILVTAAVTITLPSASTVTGRMYYIKKAYGTAGTVTIAAASGEYIDNSLSSQTLTGTTYPSIRVISDGSKWWILDKKA